jgi:mono/diheme cytochrome c family protein/rhodanese-related sulfurtransferase
VSRLAGAPLYLALCAPCHGAEGQGYVADHAPSLVNPTFLESASDDFLRRSISAGRPGTSMAAYAQALGGPLDPAGVERLVGFLRDHGPPSSPTPATAARAAGDPAVGAAIYAKRCVVCHGDLRTRGEAVSLANPQLQAAATDAFLRHAIVNGRPGTKMEAFAGQLTDGEIDGVVAYVRSLGAAGGAPVAPLPAPTGKEPVVINPSGKSPRFALRADPCPPPAPNATVPCTPDPRFASVAAVAAAFAAKQRMVIIDARAPSEWMRVHIPGAVSIPYHDLKRLAEIPRDGTWVIAYCGCPHHLSGIVVDELRKRGYAHAVVLDEGINDWHRRGFPVVAAEGVPRPLGEPAAMPPPPSRPSLAPPRAPVR